jgi:hypothetical protein
VAILCLAAFPARADKVTVRICPDDDELPNCIVAGNLRSTVTPVEPEFTGGVAILRGRITEFERGARAGDPAEPANHDRLGLLAFSPDGARVAPAPVSLQTIRIAQVFHAFDDPSDEAHLFSNRHLLRGVAFGSAAHRALLFGLVDPRGDMGLGDGAPAGGAGLTEGALTGYILNGRPAHESLYTKWTMSQADPFAFTFIAGEPISARTYARAQAHPEVFAEGWDSHVAAALGLICGFARIDPYLAPQNLFDAAERARQIGLQCRQDLGGVFFDAMYERRSPSSEREEAYLPVSQREVVVAAINVLRREIAFRYYPWVQAVPDGSVYLAAKALDEPNSDLVDRLVELLSGPQLPTATSDYSGDGEIGAQGRLVLERLAFGGDPELDPADDEYLELDRRYYRRALVREIMPAVSHYAGKPQEPWDGKRTRLALGIMCSHGWGREEDMLPFVEEIADRADEGPVAKNAGRLLGIVAATAEEAVVSRVRELLDETRERLDWLKQQDEERYVRERETLERHLAGYRDAEPRARCN